ncbi:MAG: hypothetical protein BHV90_24020 [Clostridiales bacterium 42_27]|nr:MAG: hypothetical protein BHV90_24020 [Clostridiales bacterium 42_27]
MQNEPKASDFCTTFRQLWGSGQEKSRLYTRNFVNDYDFGVKRATLAQTPATFTATMPATFARSQTTMPATFATFPAILAERHARRSIHRSPPETAPPEQAAPGKATGEQGRRQAHRASGKSRSGGATPRHKAINNGHRASGAAAV